MVGSAIWRRLERAGHRDLVGAGSDEVDLRDRDAVSAYVDRTRPDVVVLAAARVGGILANSTRPVEFLSDNLRIQTNVMDAALEHGVRRLLFLGSSCIYPRVTPQPITEEALLTGPPEPTNDAYAIAKIAGITQVRAVRRQHGLPWISAMPTNLYGPGDNFDPESSHVLPALVRRFTEAAEAGAPSVTVWGSGRVRREFLHVDDLADACLHLLDHYDDDVAINVGVGTDVSIAELAEMIAETVGFTGRIDFDRSKPDGVERKLLDVSRMSALGWTAGTSLRAGLRETAAWFAENRAVARLAVPVN